MTRSPTGAVSWPPGSMRRLIVTLDEAGDVAAAAQSYGKISGRHEDVEEGGSAHRERSESALDRRIEIGGLFHALARSAVRFCELDVVRRRRDDVAEELPGPDGRALGEVFVHVPRL